MAHLVSCFEEAKGTDKDSIVGNVVYDIYFFFFDIYYTGAKDANSRINSFVFLQFGYS